MRKWLVLILSSAFEIGWATGLKYAQTSGEWFLTVVCIIGSSIFLVLSTKMLPPSIAYISFVVFGAVGTYLLDVFVFDKLVNLLSILAIAAMLFSIFKLDRCK